MKKLLPLLIFATLLTACSGYKERNNPLLFLHVNNAAIEHKGDGWALTGELTNSALSTSYRLVQVRVTYLGDNGAELGSEPIMIANTIADNTTRPFSATAYHRPSNTRSIEVPVTGAVRY